MWREVPSKSCRGEPPAQRTMLASSYTIPFRILNSASYQAHDLISFPTLITHDTVPMRIASIDIHKSCRVTSLRIRLVRQTLLSPPAITPSATSLPVSICSSTSSTISTSVNHVRNHQSSPGALLSRIGQNVLLLTDTVPLQPPLPKRLVHHAPHTFAFATVLL